MTDYNFKGIVSPLDPNATKIMNALQPGDVFYAQAPLLIIVETFDSGTKQLPLCDLTPVPSEDPEATVLSMAEADGQYAYRLNSAFGDMEEGTVLINPTGQGWFPITVLGKADIIYIPKNLREAVQLMLCRGNSDYFALVSVFNQFIPENDHSLTAEFSRGGLAIAGTAEQLINYHENAITAVAIKPRDEEVE